MSSISATGFVPNNNRLPGDQNNEGRSLIVRIFIALGTGLSSLINSLVNKVSIFYHQHFQTRTPTTVGSPLNERVVYLSKADTSTIVYSSLNEPKGLTEEEFGEVLNKLPDVYAMLDETEGELGTFLDSSFKARKPKSEDDSSDDNSKLGEVTEKLDTSTVSLQVKKSKNSKGKLVDDSFKVLVDPFPNCGDTLP